MNTAVKPLLSGLGLILAASALVVAPRLADATTLTGDSIQVYRLYPDTATVYDTLGPVTAPGMANGGGEHVLVSANQITFTPYFGSSSFGPATFNGFEILDLTKNPHIIGVSVNSASTAPLASISDFSFTSNAVGASCATAAPVSDSEIASASACAPRTHTARVATRNFP